MPTPILDRTWHVRVQYSIWDQQCENEFYVGSAATSDALVSDALADVFDNWVTSDWMPLMQNTALYTGLVVECYDPDFPLSTPYPKSPTVAGGNGSGLDNSMTLSIQRIIAERYKGGHPRIYTPGIPAGELVDVNHVGTSWVNDVIAALNTLTSDLLADPNVFTPIALRTTGSGCTQTTPCQKIILGYRAVNNVVDSQRRRLPGRGR